MVHGIGGKVIWYWLVYSSPFIVQSLIVVHHICRMCSEWMFYSMYISPLYTAGVHAFRSSWMVWTAKHTLTGHMQTTGVYIGYLCMGRLYIPLCTTYNYCVNIIIVYVLWPCVQSSLYLCIYNVRAYVGYVCCTLPNIVAKIHSPSWSWSHWQGNTVQTCFKYIHRLYMFHARTTAMW